AGSRIVVHGDYDVDGVCATAVLVRALRRAGAQPAWHLPSRGDEGYGLSAATVTRLAAQGTGLLVTVDCATTAVEEVAAARAAGIEVVVTDHHRPRADGRLPDAPIVHPGLGDYPCAELCATAVAWKVALALDDRAEEDLDLVALATIADVVPLQGENRALVSAGLRALAATDKPGLRALMGVAQVDPSGLDARAVGFRLAPRINAAGRIARADAALELVMTGDEQRAEAVAAELDAANAERRAVETRTVFSAEAQVAELGDRPAYVLWGEDWHPGVIGIVASRLAERHHRPTVLVALDGDGGTGSGRSIPGWDLLAGLQACASLLGRHGGHRAAAGLEIARDALPAFRAAFEHHAAATLTPDDLVPVQRADAVASGACLDLGLAEELERLEPCGHGNPAVKLLVPAAGLVDPREMGEGKHVRFAVESGGVRARAVAFGCGGRLPVPDGTAADVVVSLERNAFNGRVEPRLVLGSAAPCAPAPVTIVGEPASLWEGVLAELGAPLEPAPLLAAARTVVDRRGEGLAGVLADLVATGEPVLVACAHVPVRSAGMAGRLGGFALCSHVALARDPALAAPHAHVVALDPPGCPAEQAASLAAGNGWAHLAWGEPELGFAQQINEQEYGLRAPLTALYRALRGAGDVAGEALEAVLRGDASHARTPAVAGRALRVLAELGLVTLDRERMMVTVLRAPARTALERSAAFRAYEQRREDGQRFLSQATAQAPAPAAAA
ncbi:MAG: single-stranded-DNA-specific exonuclease RecJ, partial [Solirubrobacteraceae bacterium]